MKSKSRIDKRKYKFDNNEYNSKFWIKDGKYHREKDKPAIIWSNGDMDWYKNGKFIRKIKK